MRTEAEIKSNGMKALVDNLGLVEAEKFISLLQREQFDYTKWQRNLWAGMSVQEISKMAMENIKNKEKL